MYRKSAMTRNQAGSCQAKLIDERKRWHRIEMSKRMMIEPVIEVRFWPTTTNVLTLIVVVGPNNSG